MLLECKGFLEDMSMETDKTSCPDPTDSEFLMKDAIITLHGKKEFQVFWTCVSSHIQKAVTATLIDDSAAIASLKPEFPGQITE
jgi:hypothetical protein